MALSPTVFNAAQALGEALHGSAPLKAYAQAQANCMEDAEFRSLEARFQELHAALSGREQAGEILSPAEVQTYHRLREQMRRHPHYGARERAFRAIKTHYAETVDALNSVLTVNFADLAQKE